MSITKKQRKHHLPLKQEGSKVVGRVLAIDVTRRRVTLTLKKALVESKLKPLTSWEVCSIYLHFQLE